MSGRVERMPEGCQSTRQIRIEVRQTTKSYATSRLDEVVCARKTAISDIRVIRVEVERVESVDSGTKKLKPFPCSAALHSDRW